MRTIIDVGGQDTKVIRVGEGGRLEAFKIPLLRQLLQELGRRFVDLPMDPQFTGAYGAAILAGKRR